MPEVLNRASSQDFKTSGFPLNPESFRDGNDGDVVTIMRPSIFPMFIVATAVCHTKLGKRRF